MISYLYSLIYICSDYVYYSRNKLGPFQ